MTPNIHRVAILTTHIGHTIPICNDPSVRTVRDFITEQHRRYDNGEPAGPSGLPSVKITAAHYYRSQMDFIQGQPAESEIDISDIARPNQ